MLSYNIRIYRVYSLDIGTLEVVTGCQEACRPQQFCFVRLKSQWGGTAIYVVMQTTSDTHFVSDDRE